MVHLIRSGALQYANANPVEEARLAWELAGDLMARREGGQPEEQPALAEERPSLAAREGPAELERAPQRHVLQRYLQRMNRTDVTDVLEQDQPSWGPLTIHFRRSARSTDQENPDTTPDRVDLQ